MEKILILGASGTVGSAVYQRLNQCDRFEVYGTYFSQKPDDPHMRYFSLENIERITELLEEVAPDIVISTLRGDFEKQVKVHTITAEYLGNRRGRLLYFSSVNVFDGKLDSPHYENDTLQAVSEYGKFKICCENRLREILGNQAVILRIPFVYGKNSARMRQIKDGCKAGALEVYKDLICNFVTDLQIADYVEWIVKEGKEGIFHIGTKDILRYSDYIDLLIKESGVEYPVFHYLDSACTMAVLTERRDIPRRLEWNVEKVVRFLCETD